MDVAATRGRRVKRLYRAETRKPMQLAERDVSLLGHIAQHRFLSSDHLIALDGGSPQNVRRCLRALFDHGFVDRPTAQLARLSSDGPSPFVYAVTRKGARVLYAQG